MDARLARIATILVLVLPALGANYVTPNFVVSAPTVDIAKQVAEVAENSRDELAILWLGRKLPRWHKPCPIQVKVGQIGAGGATSFNFDRGEVFGWQMNVQGTLERILDSVIPHEVSHTIFATHFRRPLPRWADEGAATLVEHESERRRQQLTLQQCFKGSRRMTLRKLLAIKEYPQDMQGVLTLYAQGYSLADYLVQRGGRTRYLTFLEDAHHRGWDWAIQKHYAYKSVDELDQIWSNWFLAGSPDLQLPAGSRLASNDRTNGATVRGQNPAGSQDRREATGAAARQDARPIDLATEEISAPAPGPTSRPGHGAELRDSRNQPESDFPPSGATRAVAGSASGEQEERLATAGRVRALRDGWVPVTSNPERRSPARPASEERNDVASRKESSRDLSLTDFRQEGEGDRNSFPGRRDSRGNSSWSNFPSNRAVESGDRAATSDNLADEEFPFSR